MSADEQAEVERVVDLARDTVPVTEAYMRAAATIDAAILSARIADPARAIAHPFRVLNEALPDGLGMPVP